MRQQRMQQLAQEARIELDNENWPRSKPNGVVAAPRCVLRDLRNAIYRGSKVLPTYTVGDLAPAAERTALAPR